MSLVHILLVVLVVVLLLGAVGPWGNANGPFWGTGYYGGGGLGLIVIVLLILILVGRV